MIKPRGQGSVIKIVSFSIAVLCGFLFLYFLLSKRGYLPPPLDFAELVCGNWCGNNQAPGLFHTISPGEQLLNSQQKLTQVFGKEAIDRSKTSLLIEKSRYRLTVYYDHKPLKSYRVVFGSNPVDDKLKEGDMRTPEGIFKVREILAHENWSKFIWLDYPTKDSWQKHINAKIKGKISWFDSVGSEIGIHGVPAGSDDLIDNKSNWTWGCISLKTNEIDELSQVLQKDTVVEIVR